MSSVVPAEKIAARAYELWESEGKPNGRDLDHWIQAASELTPAAKPAKKKAAAASNPAPTTSEAVAVKAKKAKTKTV